MRKFRPDQLARVMREQHGDHAEIFVRMQISRCARDRPLASAAWAAILATLEAEVGRVGKSVHG